MIHQHLDGIVDSTVVHRIVKKFERPSSEHTELLKSKCVDDWLSNEQRIREVPKKYFHSSARARQNVSKAKKLIQQWTKSYSYHKNNDNRELRFPSGESFVANRGKVSFHQKMLNPEVFGNVTIDCVDAAIDNILSHRTLRRCAKAHLKKLTKEETAMFYKQAWPDLRRNKPIGDWILSERIKNELFKPVNGSRLSSVYKNTEERRLINVEAFQNVVEQLDTGTALRAIHSEVGNELDFGQERHRRMIQHPIYATLDVKGGSNSTILKMVEILYKGTPLWTDILTSRSEFMLANIPADYGRVNAYVETGMLSAMGNGYTFEILALTLLALCRAIDPNASVYGDDIIVERRFAQEVAETIGIMGYELNLKKSYLDGTFRESCGAFYLDGHGYVSCYDIKWCHNINDVINTINKLGRIINNNGTWNTKVTQILRSTYAELIRITPNFIKGPVTELSDLPRWVESYKKDWAKSHREDDYCRLLYQQTLRRYKPLLDAWNYSEKDLNVIHVYSPRNVILHKVYDVVTKPWTLGYYLMSAGSGGRAPDLLRQEPERRKYRRETLILLQGNPIKMSDARRALRDTGS